MFLPLDVQKLVPASLLGDSVIQGIAKEFNSKNLRVMRVDDHKVTRSANFM